MYEGGHQLQEWRGPVLGYSVFLFFINIEAMIIMKIPYRRLWLLGEREYRVLLITSAASNDSAKEDGKSLTFDPPSRDSGKHHCTRLPRDHWLQNWSLELRMNLFLLVEGRIMKGSSHLVVFMFRLAKPADASENRSNVYNFILSS